MDPEPMIIDSTNHHTNNHSNNNSNNNYKHINDKGSSNDLTHLRSSVLDFISTHNKHSFGGTTRAQSECDHIVASLFDQQHIQDPKHYTLMIKEINSLISNHLFNRSAFLHALLQPSHPSLPPLLFVYLLHAHDIVSLSDLLDTLQVSRHEEFVQQVREAYNPSTSNNDHASVFDDVIVCLVDLAFDNPDTGLASGILAKICDPVWSVRRAEALKRLHHVLKRVSKMRPTQIPKSFFMTRLLALFGSNGPSSELSILEDHVKKILNPPVDPPSSKTEEEDETKDNLGRIFSEFSTILSIEDIVGGISKVSLTLQCDWEMLVKFVQYLIFKVRDFGLRMADPLHNLAKEAVTNINEDLLKVTLMWSWTVLPFEAYTNWFTTNFCTTATTLVSSKNLRQLLAKAMTALVSVESMKLTQYHRSSIKKHPELRAVMHDYLVVDRAAPVSSSIGRTASVEDAVVNIRNFLESYRQHGKIPEKLRTLQYFGQSWFKSTFLPTILSLEEEQKHTPLPDFKDIHLFVKALQAQGVMTQNDVINWRALQDEHIAKVRASLRLAKGRTAEKVGRLPTDPLRGLLREFVDRARVHNFQDGSLLSEIASRVNDLLSTHQDQVVPCVNLLLHAFCEVSSQMAKENNEARTKCEETKGQVPSVQLNGDFVRRILMLASVRAATRERIRELVCVLALELDDVHITCLALLLAHIVATTEREGPTENSGFANEIFRQLHDNIRNTSWMGFAAKFSSKFVTAIPVVASYVIVPDSLDDTPTDENEPMVESPYDYSLVPPLALRILIWLKSRYSFGQQVVALCSSHTSMHHHVPTFIDFSNTATLLLATLPPATYSHALARLSGSFSLAEFVHVEMRVAACGDFLDGVWKVEYIRKMLREIYSTTQPFSSFLESLLRALLNAERSEALCACSRTVCTGRAAVLSVTAEFLDSDTADTIFGFIEKELDNSMKSQPAPDVTGPLSMGLELLAHMHPLAFNLTAVKSLLYTFAKHLKFLVPFQATPLPHMVTHPSSLLFVLLARVFGLLVRKQPELAATIKELAEQAPQGFFFAMNSPLYRKTTSHVGADESSVSTIYSSLDSVHSWIDLLMQGQCDLTNLKEVTQTITSLPTIAAHALYHSTFTLSNPLPIIPQSIHDKVSKTEFIISLLCATLTKVSTFDAISNDKTFEFLANLTDVLVFHLSSSPSYNLKQLHPPTSLPTAISTQRESTDEIVESLLIVLLVRQPFLISVFIHPTQLPFLTTGRTSLFPSSSRTPALSSRYPFIMYLALTSIPTTTLAKIMGGPAGALWQRIILEAYAISQKTPHPSYNLSGTFKEKVEQWICGWIEQCGVDAMVAEKVLQSSSDLPSRISSTIRQHVLLPDGLQESGKREKRTESNMVKRNLFSSDQP